MKLTPEDQAILAEAEDGEVVCQLYARVEDCVGVTDKAGAARDAICRRLEDAGLLRFFGWDAQISSPFGMVSTWRKA